MKRDQLSFFDNDESRKATYRTKDEIDHEKETRRKSKAKSWRAPRVPAHGPACLRCVHWREPLDGDQFGSCRMLSVLEERVPHRSLEKGTVIATDDANALRLPVEPLRTTAWASCSAYHAAEEVAA